MDIRVIEELGLSTAESRVYIALLEVGQSASGKIIDRTKLQSSTVYHVLGSLVEKGIVSYIFKGKVKYFSAESPQSLLLFLDEKKKKFLDVIDELEEMEKIGRKKQTAKVYEGFKGVRAAFNDVLETVKKGEEYYFFYSQYANLDDSPTYLFFRSYHLDREEKGIKVKGLTMEKGRKTVKKVFAGLKNASVKYTEDLTPSGIVIYGDKVLTNDFSDIPTAFVIESKAIADSYKKFFLEKWEKAKS